MHVPRNMKEYFLVLGFVKFNDIKGIEIIHFILCLERHPSDRVEGEGAISGSDFQLNQHNHVEPLQTRILFEWKGWEGGGKRCLVLLSGVK